MNTQEITQACEDYGVTAEDLRTAAIAELLAVGQFKQKKSSESVKDLAERVKRVMEASQIVSVIRWATWRKHAKENNLKGTTVPELLELRKAG